MKSAIPYVGVTGIRTPKEAEAAVQIFEKHGLHSLADRTGMIGVLTAADEKYRGKTAATRHVQSMGILQDTFSALRGRMLPMLHVEIDKREANNKPFAAGVARILGESGVYQQNLCHHLQLNGYPAPGEVYTLLRYFPALRLVFQIRKELVAKGGEEIVRALNAHGDAFSYAVIDSSAGTGTEFDIQSVVQIQKTLRQERPRLQLTFAGGFSPENTKSRVQRLRAEIGNADWCIDVEDKVRDPKTDALDLPRFEEYMAAAKQGYTE